MFKDLKFHKPEAAYVLLSKDADLDHTAFYRHKKYYKWLGHSLWSLFIAFALKGLVIAMLAILVYGTVPQYVAADDNGLPVEIGDVLTYSLNYQNTGALPVNGLTITDAVPTGTTYRSGSLVLNGSGVSDGGDADGGAYLGGSNSVSFTVPTIPIGASGTASFNVTVVGPEGQVVANVASATTTEPVLATGSNTTTNEVIAILVDPEVPVDPETPIDPEVPPTPPVTPPVVGPETPTTPDETPTTPDEPVDGPVDGVEEPVDTTEPGEEPGEEPTEEPTEQPTEDPTEEPTEQPVEERPEDELTPDVVVESVEDVLDQPPIAEDYLDGLDERSEEIAGALADPDTSGGERFGLLAVRTWNRTQAAVIRTVDNGIKGVQVANVLTLDNPYVERANDIIRQALIGASIIANIALVSSAAITLASGAATIISILAYLQFFATQPFLLFGRKKRERWGSVYDSITKRPITLAIVRLFDAKTSKLVATRVTDRQGRYSFIAEPGEYRLEVTKVGYKFPTEVMAGMKEGEKFMNLYHGDTFVVTEKKVLNFNIAVDPDNAPEPAAAVLKKFKLLKWQYAIAVFGPVASATSFAIEPNMWVLALFIGQVFLLYMFRKMAMPPKLDNWGVVAGLKKNEPLKNAIVRIFDTKYNKLLETQVTDKEGRYGFLVGKNVYQVTGEKAGYDRYQSEQIQVQKEEGDMVNQNFKMQSSAK
jgi:uncharacterized repeat protein (TIGR01451 family)